MRGIRAARLLFSSLIITFLLSTPSVAEKSVAGRFAPHQLG